MNATLYCNKCGTPNDAAAQFCSRCGTVLNPAMTPAGSAPAAPLSAGVAVAPYAPVQAAGVRYGGFWIRVVAFIIDAVIVRVPVRIVAAIFGLSGFALRGLGPDGFGRGAELPMLIFGGGVLALLTIAGSWLYEAFMLSPPYQATLGKMIFGMKVTDLAGNRISFARATGRHFAKYLSTMILGIGYIMAGLTERKQGLHDMLAGTLVRRF
jgi:uncharacterized RDD family membrane protein YckC